jgi:hypothetical protein
MHSAFENQNRPMKKKHIDSAALTSIPQLSLVAMQFMM